jgi:hypothetical protein
MMHAICSIEERQDRFQLIDLFGACVMFGQEVFKLKPVDPFGISLLEPLENISLIA